MLRHVASILVVIGLLLLALAARDEHREMASMVTRAEYGNRFVVRKADNPQQFRNLMSYQWLRGALVMGAGMVLLRLCRGADRLDPYSPDFAGMKEVDELGRTLDEENERHRRQR